MLRYIWSVKTSLFRLRFVRSGNVVSGGTLNNPGQNANYWSRSSYSNAERAFNLNFNASNVYPSNNNTRYTGRSLRCRFIGFGARSLLF